MSMGEDARAIREYVVGKVTLTIDNTQPLYESCREAAVDAVQNDMGTGWSREDFVMMLGGRGQTDRAEVAEVAGVAVCDVIRSWLDDGNALHVMLGDLLDLDDRAQLIMLGDHYMPDADDWPADE
jgi:hypothetical protein